MSTGDGGLPEPAAAASVDAARADDAAVLASLRKARRRRRTAAIDPFEALYRAYLTAILVGLAVWLLSGVVGDHKVAADTAHRVAAHGAPVIGMVVGVVLAVGVRSGGRGGPLVIEAADVRHVLLAPIDRMLALRGPALRRVRFGAAASFAAGVVVGLLAWRRLPGDIIAWLACGGVTAALAVVGSYGLALVASGLRIGSRAGRLLALAIAGWSAADIA